MSEKLPGTTFEIGKITEDCAEDIFRTMFAGGGLMLSQVSQLTGLEPYIVQNWVKRGFLSSPQRKQYSRNQFCRIVIINMMRESMQMEKICALLSYINGRLDDESDNLMGDSEIYNLYCNLLAATQGKALTDDLVEGEAERLAGCHTEDINTKKRLKKVLMVMALVHRSAILRQKAELLFCEID